MTYKNSIKNGLKWLLLLVPLLFVVLTMVVSMAGILLQSCFDQDGFTLQYFQEVFTEKYYRTVLFNTLKTAFVVMACTLILAFPMAYLSVRAKKSGIRRIITGGVLVPYWVSMLVRIFAWQIILAKNGILNQILLGLKIINEPLELLYTTIAVIISLTHILLPYMFLSLQSVMEGIDCNLTLAAEGMGAKPARNFKDVFLPLSIPGILSGSMMVFVLSLGFYIAPALLGGANDRMMSNIIQQKINSGSTNVSSALSIVLLVVVMFFIAIAYKVAGDSLFKRKA